MLQMPEKQGYHARECHGTIVCRRCMGTGHHQWDCQRGERQDREQIHFRHAMKSQAAPQRWEEDNGEKGRDAEATGSTHEMFNR